MKKGISLIVLVITIIVIIILAGAVILSLASNNPINQASLAVKEQDKVSLQSAVNMLLAKEMAEERSGDVSITAGDLDGAGYTVGTSTGNFTTATLGVAIPTHTTYQIDIYGNVTY